MEQATLKTLQYSKIIDKLADNAQTVQGRELARGILPADDFATAKDNLQETAQAVNIMQEMSPPFGGIFDIRTSVQKTAIGTVLEPGELVNIISTMYGMRNLKKFFKESTDSIDCEKLKNWAASIEILGQLERQLHDAIDEHGRIRDTASNELYRLRQGIRSAQNRIKSTLNSILHNTTKQKYFQENIVTIRDERYVIPIKQEYRQYFPGIVHDQSASGSTVFIEPMTVVSLNNDIKQFKLSEKNERERILRDISVKIAKNADVLQQNCLYVAKLDFTFAKARLAAKMLAILPELNEEGHTELLGARHPLLLQENIVPIDIKIGINYKSLLITGPNTGGKTVSLKTFGLLAVMAQSGLFIPALEGSKLAFYPQIFADIGDEQSIEQNLSTFSAHMTHIIYILQHVLPNDLVLLDELGSGTDPEEGAALAMAVLEKFMQISAQVMATTHYNELKTFAYTHDNIQNASVEFDAKTLTPTYRLLIGVPGASNAFAISSRLGLSKAVILRAKELIRADHANFEHVLNKLESEKSIYEQKNANITEKERSIFILEKKLREEKEELDRKKSGAVKKMQRECASILRDTRRQAEAVIKELKEQFNDSGIQKRQQVIQAARQKLQSDINKFNLYDDETQQQGVIADPEKTKPGDSVFLKNLKQSGIVKEAHGSEFIVMLGSLKTKVKAKDCLYLGKLKASEKQQPKKHQSQFSPVEKKAHIKREIDLRGMMVNEAEEILDKYIDDAVMAGLKEIIIIHGKGTGALRKGVQSYLKRHHNVLSYSLAGISEGGSGATIVQLQ